MTPRQFFNAINSRIKRYSSAAARRIGLVREDRQSALKNDRTAHEIQKLKSELTTQLSFMNNDLLTEMEGMFLALGNSLSANNDKPANPVQQRSLRSSNGEGLAKADAERLLARLDELATLSSERTNLILGRLNEIDNRVFESTNRILGAQSTSDNRLVEIANGSFEISNAVQHLSTNTASRLNEIINQHFPTIMEQVHEAAALQLLHDPAKDNFNALKAARPRPVGLQSMDDLLARASSDFPQVYDAWFERYMTVLDVMSKTKVGNAAYGGDTYSRLFKVFLERYANGALLDVGCGPYGRPYYLKDYPSNLIVGLDPMPSEDFENNISLIRGISEYLPFEDGVFDTVVSATSLDHCLSLDRSLDEITRVLSSDGTILLWLGSTPGSPAFDPFSPIYQPADQYHLFHFDIAWFEPILEQRFEILERVKLEKAAYAHVFYALKKIRN